MDTNSENGRPNIRIEIKNTSEPMDVDDDKSEEGEIRETNTNKENTFSRMLDTVGVKSLKDVFKNSVEIAALEVDQKKLQERAKRFALKPDEINTFTEQDLHDLNMSLGITLDNAEQLRFEAIHVRSSSQIDVEQVIAYFSEYAPVNIEWVDDESYNIVWDDKLFTARTLFHISQAVRGMPVRVATEHVIDNFILDDSDLSKDDILLSKNRLIEFSDDCVEENYKIPLANSVDISVINIPIPPGYWRLGKKCINSFSVLMRFSMIVDKKPYKIEKCSKYYKHNFLNKRNEQHGGIFSRNKDICREVSDKNPWGVLARNWDEDLKFREKDRQVDIEPLAKKVLNSDLENPELRIRLAAKRRITPKPIQEKYTKTSTSEIEQSDESDQENKKKERKLKMPRMRMYADEEEEKIKRRKLLQTLKKQSDKLKSTEIPNCDLRNILRITNRKSRSNISQEDDIDLSVNLKNRNRKLVFTVAQDALNSRAEPKIRSERRISPIRERKPISPIHFKHDVSPEDFTKWPNSRETHKKHHRSSIARGERYSERKYNGRMYSSKSDEDSYSIHKPKSKVALVIKTQKKPSVASAIQSRTRKFDTSSSSSDDSSTEESESDSSEEESTSSSSESESDSSSGRKKHHTISRRLGRTPFKVEIKNEQCKRK